MPVAFLKGANSSKLVLKDVATGSRNVTKSSHPHQTKWSPFGLIFVWCDFLDLNSSYEEDNCTDDLMYNYL